MHRQPSTVHIIRLFTQQIEELRVDHADQEVEGRVCIGHDEEQCCFLISDGIQGEFIVHGNVSNLLNIEGSEPCTAANKHRFCCFASCQFVLGILPNCEVIRLLFLQCLKHEIHRILKGFVILTDLHGVQKLDKRREILLLLRCLIVDISDKGTVQKRFCLRPEFITGLAIALGVGNQRSGQLQNVLFTVDILKGIVMHGFFKILNIKYADFIRFFQ